MKNKTKDFLVKRLTQKILGEAPMDYGDYPERMDPKTEKEISNPESTFAKALRGGSAKVEQLASARFKKIADRLRELTGIPNLTGDGAAFLLQRELMNATVLAMEIESQHKSELEQLAVKACLEEAQMDEDFVKINADITSNPGANFRMEPDEEPDFSGDEPESFDVEDLTKKEKFDLEKGKRILINSIIQGIGKKSHFFFQKPEVKDELDSIDNRLYPAYMKIMAINDLLYFTMQDAIDLFTKTGDVGGSVSVESDPDASDDEPNVTINAKGILFPILAHEIFKGFEEIKGVSGLPEDPQLSKDVEGQTDVITNEPMQLRIGPEIVERLRYAMPAEIFEPDNKGLINWFQIELYKLPAKQFIDVINDVISDEDSDNKKALKVFDGLLRTAKQKKDEYEKSKPEKTSNNTDDDDEDFNSFLNDLGIS